MQRRNSYECGRVLQVCLHIGRHLLFQPVSVVFFSFVVNIEIYIYMYPFSITVIIYIYIYIYICCMKKKVRESKRYQLNILLLMALQVIDRPFI